MDSTDGDELDTKALQRLVVEAMDRARRRAGLTAEEMTRRLRPALGLREAPPESEARAYWYHWRRSPRAIPAMALVAAARIAGTTVDRLIEEEPTASTVPIERVEAMERQVERLAEVEREVARLRRLVKMLQADVQDVQAEVGLPRLDARAGG